MQVNVHEAKTHLSRLIDQAHEGQEIVLAKAGVPWARLVPLAETAKPKRQPGRLKGVCPDDSVFFEPLPEEELDALESGPLFPAA